VLVKHFWEDILGRAKHVMSLSANIIPGIPKLSLTNAKCRGGKIENLYEAFNFYVLPATTETLAHPTNDLANCDDQKDVLAIFSE
jgi:hypothetical protein